MKKICSEALQKFLDTILLEKDNRYYIKFIGEEKYLYISNIYIIGSSDRKVDIHSTPSYLYYWEVLYILNIIKKYGEQEEITNIEIGKF
jgi:hypothetical protein